MVPCSSCKDHFVYDALLSGLSLQEFEQWYEKIKENTEVYRCAAKGCHRRVSKEGLVCSRCHRANGNKKKLENKKYIIQSEKIMMDFVAFCEKQFPNLTTAAKEFGVNTTYIYTIKNFDIYPSKSMLFAMKSFIQVKESCYQK
jgi:hypothetical protein